MGKRDANSGEWSRDVYIAALKTELAGYVSSGNAKGEADVRAELERVGAGEAPSRPSRGPVEREVAAPAETATPVRKSTARKKPATRRKKGPGDAD